MAKTFKKICILEFFILLFATVASHAVTVNDVLRKHPRLASVSRDDINNRLAWLTSNKINNLESFIDRYPNIFEFEFSELQPIWSHFVNIWGATPDLISESPDILELPFDEVQLMAMVLQRKGIQIKDILWEHRLELIRKRPAQEAYDNIDKVVPQSWRAPKETKDLADEKITWMATIGVEDADKVYNSARGMFRGPLPSLRSKVSKLRERKLEPGPFIHDHPEILGIMEAKYWRLYEWVVGIDTTHSLKVIYGKLDQMNKVRDWLEKINVSDPLRVLSMEHALIQDPSTLQNQYDWFRKKGITNVVGVLTTSPKTFLLDVNHTLEPNWTFLEEEWGFGAAEIEAGQYLGYDFVQVRKIGDALKQMNLPPKEQSMIYRKELMANIQKLQAEPFLNRFQKGETVTIYDILGKRNPRAPVSQKVENVDKLEKPVRASKPRRESIVRPRQSNEKVQWLSDIGVEGPYEVYRSGNQVFAAMKLEELKTRTSWLMERRENAASLISKRPEILYICEDKYKPLLEWLVRTDLEFVNTNIEQSKRTFEFLLSIGVPDLELLYRYPRLVFTLRENYEWLQQQKLDDLKNILLRNPEIFLLDLEIHVKPRWNHLKDEWDLAPHDIKTATYLLLIPLERMQNIAKSLSDINTSPKELSVLDRKKVLRSGDINLLEKAREVLDETADLQQPKYKSLLEWIKKEDPWLRYINLKRAKDAFDALEGIGISDPMLAIAKTRRLVHTENLREKFEWFQEKGVVNVKEIVLAYPDFFLPDLETNLKAKWNHLESEWGLKGKEIAEGIYVLHVQRERVEEVAKLLNQMNLNPKMLSLPERRTLVRSGDPKLLERLLERHKTGETITINDILPRQRRRRGVVTADAVTAITSWLSSVGVSNPEAFLKRSPPEIYQPTEHLQRKADWFRKKGIRSISNLLERAPKTFILSDEMLELKWNHLINDWGFTIEDLEASPVYLQVDVEQLSQNADIMKRMKIPPTSVSLSDRKQIIREVQIKRMQMLLDRYQKGEKITVYDILGKIDPKKTLSQDELEKIQWLKNMGVQNPEDTYASRKYIFSDDLSKLEAKAIWLRQHGITELGPLLTKHPDALLLSEDKYGKLLDWLKETYPTLESVEMDEAKKVYDWLESIGVSDPIDLLKQVPRFIFSIERLQKKYEWFQHKGVKQLTAFFLRTPRLFTYSIEDYLEPLTHHLEAEWGITVTDWEPVPSILSYRLERLQDISKLLKEMNLSPLSQTLADRKNLMIVSLEQLKVFHEKFQKRETVTIYDILEKENPDLSVKPLYRETVEWLATFGLDGPSTLQKYPEILDRDLEILKERVEFLTKVGVKDIKKRVRKEPRILALDENDFKKRVAYLSQIGADIGKVTFAFARYFFVDFQTIVDRVDWFARQGVKDVGSFVSRYPQTLGVQIDETLAPMWNLLIQEWGASVEQIENQPFLLMQSRPRVTDLTTALKSKGVDIPKLSWALRAHMIYNYWAVDVESDLKKVLSEPWSIHQDTAEERTAKIEWLKELGVADPQAALSAKKVFAEKLEVLKERAEALQQLGFKNIARMIELEPRALSEDLNAKEKLDWLREIHIEDPIKTFETSFSDFATDLDSTKKQYEMLLRLGFTVDELPRLIRLCPRLLFGSELRFRNLLAWLKTQGFLEPMELIRRSPNFAVYSIDKLDSRIKGLKKVGFKDVTKMVTVTPTLLMYDIEENIEPTLEHFKTVWEMSVEEIEGKPELLMMSLSRLKEVAAALEELGQPPYSFTGKQRYWLIAQARVDRIKQNLIKAGKMQPNQVFSDVRGKISSNDIFPKDQSNEREISPLSQEPFKTNVDKKNDFLSMVGGDALSRLSTLSWETIQQRYRDVTNLGFKPENIPPILKIKPEVLTNNKEWVKSAIDELKKLRISDPVGLISKEPLFLESPENLRSAVRWLKGQGFKNIDSLIVQQPELLLLNGPKYKGLREWLSEIGVENPVQLIKSEYDYFLTRPLSELKREYATVTDLAVDNKAITESRWLESRGFKNVSALVIKDSYILRLAQPLYRGLVEWLSEMGIKDPPQLIANNLQYFLDNPLSELKRNPKQVREWVTRSTGSGSGGASSGSEKCESLWEFI